MPISSAEDIAFLKEVANLYERASRVAFKATYLAIQELSDRVVPLDEADRIFHDAFHYTANELITRKMQEHDQNAKDALDKIMDLLGDFAAKADAAQKAQEN